MIKLILKPLIEIFTVNKLEFKEIYYSKPHNKVLFVIDSALSCDDDFISIFYDKAGTIEDDHKPLHISFVGVENISDLNKEELEDDWYGKLFMK